MRPAWIFHHVKLLAQFDQPVDEKFATLEVHIIVVRTMNEQQVPLQARQRS